MKGIFNLFQQDTKSNKNEHLIIFFQNPSWTADVKQFSCMQLTDFPQAGANYHILDAEQKDRSRGGGINSTSCLWQRPISIRGETICFVRLAADVVRRDGEGRKLASSYCWDVTFYCHIITYCILILTDYVATLYA